MASRIRVLSAFEYGSLHGGEQSWLAVAPRLAELGIDLVAAAPTNSPLASRMAAVGIRCLPLDVERGVEPNDAALRDKLRRFADDERLDLIHANSLSMARRIGRVSDGLPCPTVGHLRDIIRLSRKAVSDINNNVSLFAVSQATRQFHAQQGMDEDRVSVIYNGVDLKRFQPGVETGIRRELGIAHDAVVVVSIGQIGMRKGLDVAANAIVAASHVTPNLVWLVVGQRFSEKEEARQFERRIHDSVKPMENVRFLGFRSDVPALLAGSDIVLHCARQEPLGRVLLEAAAVGRAIAATDVGGTLEILRPESEAVLFPRDDLPATQAALIRLAADKQTRTRLGTAARRRVEQLFPVELAAVRFAEALRKAIERV